MGVIARFAHWLRLFRRDAQPDPLEQAGSQPLERLRIVVGLGNPGRKYAGTRHNVGFICVDRLADCAGAHWRDDRSRTTSRLAFAQQDDKDFLLVQPLTFMNASGDAVQSVVSLTGVPLTQLLVVYDDMDLPFGTLRLRERGSPGTHNGLRSIVAALGTEDFPRLRIGIAQDRSRDARDYVLSPFTEAETDQLTAVIDRAAQAVQVWAEHGPATAMNQFNRS